MDNLSKYEKPKDDSSVVFYSLRTLFEVLIECNTFNQRPKIMNECNDAIFDFHQRWGNKGPSQKEKNVKD